MLELVTLQLVDTFLLDYHLGHALIVLFGLSVLGVIPLGSRKALSLTLLAFGLLFIVTPFSLFNDDPLFIFFGLALVLTASLVWTFARS